MVKVLNGFVMVTGMHSLGSFSTKTMSSASGPSHVLPLGEFQNCAKAVGVTWRSCTGVPGSARAVAAKSAMRETVNCMLTIVR